MTCRFIHKAVKEQVAVMGHLKTSSIAWAMKISKQTVNHVLRLKEDTGSVVHTPLIAGRPRLLNGLDVAVRAFHLDLVSGIIGSKSNLKWCLKFLESLIERTPDIFISELQFELQEARGIYVSSWTIREAMKR